MGKKVLVDIVHEKLRPAQPTRQTSRGLEVDAMPKVYIPASKACLREALDRKVPFVHKTSRARDKHQIFQRWCPVIHKRTLRLNACGLHAPVPCAAVPMPMLLPHMARQVVLRSLFSRGPGRIDAQGTLRLVTIHHGANMAAVYANVSD